jgi:hypothetical protein
MKFFYFLGSHWRFFVMVLLVIFTARYGILRLEEKMGLIKCDRVEMVKPVPAPHEAPTTPKPVNG